MEENNTYLKFLITEDIYPVDDPDVSTKEKQEKEVVEVSEITEPSEEKKHVEEPSVDNYSTTPTKKLLVLYTYQPAAKLNEPLKRLMLKIIEAVKINIKEADYVNASHQSLPNDMPDYYNIICFGEGLELNLSEINQAEKYFIQKSGQTKVLISASLEVLDSNIEEKKKLWARLKEMFA